MSYQTYLAARGYRRITIERTDKLPGDLVLLSAIKPLERIPAASRVVSLRRKAVSL